MPGREGPGEGCEPGELGVTAEQGHTKTALCGEKVLQLPLGLVPYLWVWVPLALTASSGSELFLLKGLKK